MYAPERGREREKEKGREGEKQRNPPTTTFKVKCKY